MTGLLCITGDAGFARGGFHVLQCFLQLFLGRARPQFAVNLVGIAACQQLDPAQGIGQRHGREGGQTGHPQRLGYPQRSLQRRGSAAAIFKCFEQCADALPTEENGKGGNEQCRQHIEQALAAPAQLQQQHVDPCVGTHDEGIGQAEADADGQHIAADLVHALQ